MFTSQKFIDKRSGEIVIQVPVLDINHFDKYAGTAEAGEFDRSAWLEAMIQEYGLGPEGSK